MKFADIEEGTVTNVMLNVISVLMFLFCHP